MQYNTVQYYFIDTRFSSIHVEPIWKGIAELMKEFFQANFNEHQTPLRC